MLTLVGVVASSQGCRDDDYVRSLGSAPPRLSASLSENAPGSPIYTARVLVLPRTDVAPANGPSQVADDEYLSLVTSGGAMIAFNGSASASSFCAHATGEQVFRVTSTTGVSTLQISLFGVGSADAGLPSLGPGSSCAPASVAAGESIIVNIPSAAAPPVPPDASPTDALPGDAVSADGFVDAGSDT